jgi:hypothetical protein
MLEHGWSMAKTQVDNKAVDKFERSAVWLDQGC